MKIRLTQQKSVALDSFISKIENHWLENFPDKFANFSSKDLNRLVHSALAEAQSKEISEEDQIVTYCDLCIIAKTGFAEQIK